MKTRYVIALIAAAVLGQANAEQGKLEVATKAEKEQSTTLSDGTVSTRLVPIETAVPGDEVVYTVTFTNVSNETADNVRITNPIPDEMIFVPGSAFGPGTNITFSVDGGENFAVPAELTVSTEDGQRPAVANDYTHIRWIMEGPLDAGAKGFARYRAKLR